MSTATTPRRPRLGHEAVLAEAERLIEAEGYDALTMTSLAGSLSLGVSSLYNHVANLEDLRAEIQVRAMRDLGRVVRTAAEGHTGIDGMSALATAMRDFARRFPQRYAAMTRPPLDQDAYFAATVEAAGVVAAMVRSLGVPESRMLTSQMAIFAALHGLVSLEVSGFYGPPVDLAPVFEQVLRGAVTAVVMEATRPQ